MTWRIGVDSGGTFTDVCLFDDETGALAVWKVASTPDDPSRGIATGVAEAIEHVGTSAGSVAYFGHGTTVATNALIQHRGAKTGLITTDGFRDLLEIGRQKRPDLYDIQVDKPVVLVSRDLRLEVAERVRHDGSVEVPLDQEAVRAAVRFLQDAKVEAVAVCFLYGFVSDTHEAIVSRIVEDAFPEAFRIDFPRRGAGIPRIRATFHRCGECISGPRDAQVYTAFGRPAGKFRDRRGTAFDSVEWRGAQF